MKRKHVFFLSGIITLFFVSCKDNDRIDDYTNEETANQWIENTMRENYYWYGDIPLSQNLNFQSESDVFFHSLLSSKDGKDSEQLGHYYYSTIEKKTSSLKSSSNGLSFGFEYQAYYSQQTDRYALLVLYTLPDSPASRSELKRGDWIHTINDSPISSKWSEQLNTNSLKLGVSESFNESTSKNIILNAESVFDNPILLDSVYIYNNKRIGYLIYNHFTQGANKNDTKDETYNNLLRKSFAQLSTKTPEDFILDLRYNSGGQISSAQLLATMLAPFSALGDIFCKINYSDKKASKDYSLTLDQAYMRQGVAGENLNLKRLFVITSHRTASASEAVINGLKPFLGDKLIVVGERTEGKNVGSLTYTNSKFEWELHPIICKISNKSGFSDYENGFAPNVNASEPNTNLYPLGDTREYLLNTVLNIIAGQSTDNVRSSSATDDNLIKVGSSLDNKKTNGVILSHE